MRLMKVWYPLSFMLLSFGADSSFSQQSEVSIQDYSAIQLVSNIVTHSSVSITSCVLQLGIYIHHSRPHFEHKISLNPSVHLRHPMIRSEERRVGKEFSSRLWRC